jgi:hypothetical protein
LELERACANEKRKEEELLRDLTQHQTKIVNASGKHNELELSVACMEAEHKAILEREKIFKGKKLCVMKN